MRASRLLSVLMLLQSRGKLTADQLADELEVSVRTIYRDIESLASAGIPVYGDRGPAGGYQLLGGFRTRLTGLTAEEADSLFLAGTPAAAAELGLGGVLAAAQLKVLAALPPELRERAGRIRQRFHLDAPSWFRDIESTDLLDQIADAVWQQRGLRVRYSRWDDSLVTRTLEPHGLVLKAGVWYLVARSDGQFRTYRVARIRRVLPYGKQEEHFKRDEAFDLAAYWTEWNVQFASRLYRSEAVIRLAPIARDLLAFYLGRVVEQAARDTGSPPDKDGWVTATLPIESIQHATFEFLRFGSAVEVLEPAELRDQMATEAAAVARLYS